MIKKPADPKNVRDPILQQLNRFFSIPHENHFKAYVCYKVNRYDGSCYCICFYCLPDTNDKHPAAALRDRFDDLAPTHERARSHTHCCQTSSTLHPPFTSVVIFILIPVVPFSHLPHVPCYKIRKMSI